MSYWNRFNTRRIERSSGLPNIASNPGELLFSRVENSSVFSRVVSYWSDDISVLHRRWSTWVFLFVNSCISWGNLYGGAWRRFFCFSRLCVYTIRFGSQNLRLSSRRIKIFSAREHAWKNIFDSTRLEHSSEVCLSTGAGEGGKGPPYPTVHTYIHTYILLKGDSPGCEKLSKGAKYVSFYSKFLKYSKRYHFWNVTNAWTPSIV